MSLILGEVLTRRGEQGPLARPWAAAGPKRKPPRKKPTDSSRDRRES
ncbi:MAG: hypothetical protein GY854_01725 [Deltaproteobacteria bacterium]|nr:hypothetical protein [Deltaproteobacteria bacterium]